MKARLNKDWWSGFLPLKQNKRNREYQRKKNLEGVEKSDKRKNEDYVRLIHKILWARNSLRFWVQIWAWELLHCSASFYDKIHIEAERFEYLELHAHLFILCLCKYISHPAFYLVL